MVRRRLPSRVRFSSCPLWRASAVLRRARHPPCRFARRGATPSFIRPPPARGADCPPDRYSGGPASPSCKFRPMATFLPARCHPRGSSSDHVLQPSLASYSSPLPRLRLSRCHPASSAVSASPLRSKLLRAFRCTAHRCAVTCPVWPVGFQGPKLPKMLPYRRNASPRNTHQTPSCTRHRGPLGAYIYTFELCSEASSFRPRLPCVLSLSIGFLRSDPGCPDHALVGFRRRAAIVCRRCSTLPSRPPGGLIYPLSLSTRTTRSFPTVCRFVVAQARPVAGRFLRSARRGVGR